MAANFIRAFNGEELSADEILRYSRLRVIVVTKPRSGPAVEHAVIRLPRAVSFTHRGDLTVVMGPGAFGFTVIPEAPETIGELGRAEFSAARGVRLVPLISDS